MPQEAGFAATPEPPYYAVIFTAQLAEDAPGYGDMAQSMVDLATAQPGCLGVESTRGSDNLGITVSYWRDEESIRAWKQNAKHLVAQSMGKEKWYTHYHLRVARIDRDYTGPEGR